MCMRRFNLTAKYVAGNEMFVSNALSRSPDENQAVDDFTQEIYMYVLSVTQCPASSDKLRDPYSGHRSEKLLISGCRLVGCQRVCLDFLRSENSENFGRSKT